MRTIPGVLALSTLLLVPHSVQAHDLGGTVRIRGQHIQVEAYYDDGTHAQAKVEVRNGKGEIVAQGRTDAHGLWQTAKPTPGKYRVVLDAGGGHRKELPICIDTPTGTAATSESVVSIGPTREEFTEFPWLKAGIGMAAILLFFGAIWIARMRAKK